MIWELETTLKAKIKLMMWERRAVEPVLVGSAGLFQKYLATRVHAGMIDKVMKSIFTFALWLDDHYLKAAFISMLAILAMLMELGGVHFDKTNDTFAAACFASL